ncbi:Starch-binding associating with outer membrane [Fodinibius roseus]|uniref:Starch-binding associating with outer membrane n=1 Tax=Fodinibius roseus TaxID=1194090 RepID=A0A1M5KCD9_9BACT|nr:RagB/SusD family nutrient uptake outer membrane protein [Fodinibius roseus]SHG50455.1 Starch-binding associating with outer membrane [Fodinibius roseus]
MKRLIFNLTFLITFFVVSCDNMLTESPKDLVVEDFYNSTAEVESALAASIDPVRGRMSGWWISTLDCHTVWGAGLAGSANFDSYKSMNGLSSVGASNLIPNWDVFYQSIRNANLVIANVPNSEVLSEEQKTRFLAEARFFRSFAYFQLVRGWGGVPIYTEENMDQTTGAPRATQEEVYNLITNDLEFAENNLPNEPPVLGRPDMWSAKTMLADVYFFQERYSDAATKANEVIQSGKYSLVEVTVPDDFNNLFGMDANSNEEIFYLKYNQQSTSGLVLHTMPIDTPWFGSNGYGIFQWHDGAQFYTEWNDDDFRKQFNWYVADEDKVNPFIGSDPYFPNEGVNKLAPKKYNAPEATSSTFDLPVYRYADVLLIYAEASARAVGSPTAEGLEALNMVHRRAYGHNPTEPSPVDLSLSDYPDTDSFIDRVVKERGYEFQFEGKRWFDLKRSGRVFEVMEEYIGREVAEKHLLWPIPEEEFDLNEAMDPSTGQNPGY